jgi:hypothetical protein
MHYNSEIGQMKRGDYLIHVSEIFALKEDKS